MCGYFFARLDQIDGQYDYGSALFFVPHFEAKGKYLISSLIHRILLDSILERANSKYYGYGVKYLKKLDHSLRYLCLIGKFIYLIKIIFNC
jgi:hypothetical protein